MPIKTKTSSRKKLIKALDDLVREIVKTRDGNICQVSGTYVTGSNCHWSHIIPVSAGHRLRWDPMNSLVMSYHNHINWWHKNPIISSKWFEEKFPERYAYLQEESRKPNLPIKEWELQELYDNLLANKEKLCENGTNNW